MRNSLFVCATDRDAGSSVVSLGLMASLSVSVPRLGFFKPVGLATSPAEEPDPDVLLVKSAYQLRWEASQMCPVSIGQARELAARAEQAELIDWVRRAYDEVADGNDLVVIEGLNYERSISLSDIDLNAMMAEELGAPVLLVAGAGASGPGVDAKQVAAAAAITKRSFEARGCDVLGAIVNKVPPDRFDAFRAELEQAFAESGIKLFGVLPYVPFLGMPKLDQIAEKLGARVLSGQANLDNVVMKTITAAMEPRNVLRYLQEDNTLVVTPGDREDTILAVMCSQLAAGYPKVAGIVLTGGLLPAASIIKLVSGLGDRHVPMLSVEMDTFTATSAIREMEVRIRPQDKDKIDAAVLTVLRNVNEHALWEALNLPRRPRTRPQDFLDRLVEASREADKHVVFPEGEEPRTIQAAEKIRRLGVARATLLGDPDEIRRKSQELGVDLRGVELLNPARSDKAERYAEVFYELRKHKKGITPETSLELMQASPIYFGTMMVHQGEADGLVAGAAHATADTIRPALQVIKTRPDISIASSIFFMALRDRVLIYGDCGLVTNPDAEELASIAWASAQTARAFGIEPRVAMLSYSTGTSGEGADVDKVRKATELIKSRKPDFPVDGPMQYDAAVDPEVGKRKLPGSEVAGRATVFIFPDLDAGNIAYKAVQRSANAIALGPILQGLNKPVNDLSRGCSVDDIVYVTAITAIQAART